MATYKKWTVEEIEFIKNNYNVVSDMALAVKLSEMLNQEITTSMIRRQRRKLEIIKPRGRPRKTENTQTTPSVE
jgi:hypothetical protein